MGSISGDYPLLFSQRVLYFVSVSDWGLKVISPNQLKRQPLSAFLTASFQNLAAGSGARAPSKAVLLLGSSAVWLVSSFWHNFSNYSYMIPGFFLGVKGLT